MQDPDTELALFDAIAEGLMARPIESRILSRSGTYAAATRRIEMDFFDDDIGPIIGAQGSTKLAIQTLLACPFGGDNCHLVMHSTRSKRALVQGDRRETQGRIRKILTATQDHLAPHRFQFRIEASETATVVLIETNSIFVDQIRGAMAKILRAIGRKHETVVVTSIEIPEPINA